MTTRYQGLGYNSEHIPVSYNQIHEQILRGDAKYDHRSTLTQPVVDPILPDLPRVPKPTDRGPHKPPFVHPIATQYAPLGRYF
jgi:hypothetical protein